MDWTTAFAVSSSPTTTKTHTNQSARFPLARSAITAISARAAVTMSPYPIISRNSAGTPGPTEPGARIDPPTNRNTWTHTSGTSATATGNGSIRGQTYQRAASAYATSANVNWIENRTSGSMLTERAYRPDRPRAASADPVGAEDPQDPRDGRRLPSPVLVDDLAPGLPDQMTEHDSCDHGVVERTEDGDELRDQIDRRREPDGGEAEPELRAPGD